MIRRSIPVFFLLAAALAWGQAQEATLNFDPAQTTVNFTLGDVLHTVHGSFRLKTGQVRFDPATNSISGELVVDAPSGNSGSTGRDRKMHKEILQSVRYPEVTFRPDRVDGKVLASGRSAVQVHGMFGILGVEHEITVPAQVELAPDHWSLAVHFAVPYVKWGLKDPSTFILRVEKTVDIDLNARGPSPWPAPR
ncbi:MAG TPA: YceI family protein [Terriglobales bacterium]|jgi:polyisoprenoid-binding protein YceI|nr:YceI family protein [Terriglobales bacterium]